jgi:hypothetical protein
MFEMYVYDKTNALTKRKNANLNEIRWFFLTQTFSRIDVYDIEGFAFRLNPR